MDYFTSDGVFWLPDRSDRRLRGTLTFDSDGLALRLHDSLHQFQPVEGQVTRYSPEWQTVPVVHGYLDDGRNMTLLEASGISMAGPLQRVTETWRVDFVLSGGHLADDLFERARFDFDALMPWTRPPGIVTDDNASDIVLTDLTRAAVMETVRNAGLQVRLLTGAAGTWEHTRVHLDQFCAFETSGDPHPLRDVLNGWVRPLQDLLIVALGRPVRLTSLFVRPPGAGPRDDALAVSFEAVQPTSRTPPTQAEIDNFEAPTLVTRPSSPIPVEDLVAGWYSTHERLRDVVTLLCGPFYAPFIYSEHRYASTFQAAEALARQLFTTTEKPRDEHRQRVEMVTGVLASAGIEEDVVRWATAILRGRNDKSLSALIEELVCSTADMGSRILEAVPTFPRDVARARVGVSHGGAQATDAVRRFWLGEALSWLVRVLLLVDAGVPLEDLVRVTLGKPRFGRALKELGQRT